MSTGTVEGAYRCWYRFRTGGSAVLTISPRYSISYGYAPLLIPIPFACQVQVAMIHQEAACQALAISPPLNILPGERIGLYP